jgi:hypothetical protein
MCGGMNSSDSSLFACALELESGPKPELGDPCEGLSACDVIPSGNPAIVLLDVIELLKLDAWPPAVLEDELELELEPHPVVADPPDDEPEPEADIESEEDPLAWSEEFPSEPAPVEALSTPA